MLKKVLQNYYSLRRQRKSGKQMSLRRSIELLKLHRFKTSPKPRPEIPMRFVQFRRVNDPMKHLGVVSDDGEKLVPLSLNSCCSNDMITFISQGLKPEELANKIRSQPSEDMDINLLLLPPVTNPEKIICVGQNYRDHLNSGKRLLPPEPLFFSKCTNSLIGPTGDVIAHKITHKLDWEVELAVIIGKVAKNVHRTKALDYVFGYSVAQDISARDWQTRKNGILIGKSMDTFCPLGPSIVHKSLIPDPNNLNILTKINGVIKQNGNTRNMIYRIEDIITDLSSCITLKPGDVILTGTPAGVAMHYDPPVYLKPGDVIESQIQSIGKLINNVVKGY